MSGVAGTAAAGPTDAFIASLESATQAAAAAEAAWRNEAVRRTAMLAAERAFAFRRLNLLRAVTEAVAAAPDEETGVAHGLAMLRSRLGWTLASEAQDEIVGAFAPVCVALRAGCAASGAVATPVVAGAATAASNDAAAWTRPVADDAAPVAEAGPPAGAPDPAAALAAFEAWYAAARQTPFWLLFEHYMPETPLVDF